MWNTETLELIIHVAGSVSWGMAILLLLLTPGLLGIVVSSYTHSRLEDLSGYITKFVPYPIFVISIYLIHFFAVCNIVLHTGLRLAHWTDVDLFEFMSREMWFVLGFVALPLFYHLTFSLWSCLYMPLDGAVKLRQDYFVISLLRVLVLLVMEVVLFSPIDPRVYLWVLVAVLAVVQSLRWLQTFRRLWSTSVDHVYIFLYLCAHEILPWLCVTQLIWYSSEN